MAMAMAMDGQKQKQKLIRKHVEKVIKENNEEEFASFLRSPEGKSCELSLSQLWRFIIRHSATNCAYALLQQDFGFCMMDVNMPLDDGISLLHFSAHNLSSSLTTMTLLNCGAKIDVCDERGMLPLHTALNSLSDKWLSDWSPEKSVYKLLYVFCLPKLDEALLTIRLLALRTKDIDRVSLHLVEKGDIVQLAALLMSVWDQFVPWKGGSAEKCLVAKHIFRLISDITNQELQFMLNGGPDCEELEDLKSKKNNLLSQWKILKVLDIAQDLVYQKKDLWKDSPNYMVPYHVAYMLTQYKGMELKPRDVVSDDIKCLRPKLSTVAKDKLSQAIEKQLQVWPLVTSVADQSEASTKKKLFVRSMTSTVAEKPSACGTCSYLFAPQTLSSHPTSLLLHHEAQSNVNMNVSHPPALAMLPLNMALKSLCDQWASDWTSRKSVFKLLYIFCLPDLKEPLETIRLLAERTEDIEKLSLYYVEEGEVVRLAALLMGAWNRLVTPDIENVEKCSVGQHILRQITHVTIQELLFTVNCGSNCKVLECLKSRKINLVSQWKFLKVLDKARDVISEYPFAQLKPDEFDEFDEFEDFENLPHYDIPLDVAYEISTRTQLPLKADDVYSGDIECLRPKLTTVEKAHMNEAVEKQMRLWSLSPEPKTRDADRSEVNLQKELFVRSTIASLAERPSRGGCCSRFSSISSSRPYHTWGDLSINFEKVVEKSEPRNNPKLARPRSLVFAPSAKICGRLLLCAKRILK